MNTTLPLANLRPGDHAVIAHLKVDEALYQRLSAMGLRIGRPVCVVRRASLSGPIQIRVGFTDLMVRLTDARNICVTPII
ncbi:MAG: FeoA family protein [Thiobacillaceae bacterium]